MGRRASLEDESVWAPFLRSLCLGDGVDIASERAAISTRTVSRYEARVEWFASAMANAILIGQRPGDEAATDRFVASVAKTREHGGDHVFVEPSPVIEPGLTSAPAPESAMASAPREVVDAEVMTRSPLPLARSQAQAELAGAGYWRKLERLSLSSTVHHTVRCAAIKALADVERAKIAQSIMVRGQRVEDVQSSSEPDRQRGVSAETWDDIIHHALGPPTGSMPVDLELVEDG